MLALIKNIAPCDLASSAVSPAEGFNTVSKPDDSQSSRMLTLGPRCLDEQPLQQSAVLCHT